MVTRRSAVDPCGPGIALLLVALTAVPVWRTAGVRAQTVDRRWSVPVRLSSGVGRTTEHGPVVADSLGRFHVVWVEAGRADRQMQVSYARLVAGAWSRPTEIYTSRPGYRIGPPSLEIDAQDRLHLSWTESNIEHTLGDRPARSALVYTTATGSAADQAQGWRPPVTIPEEAVWARLQVEPTGVLHLLNANAFGDPKGVFHRRSTDGGRTWSAPTRVDVALPPAAFPYELQLRVDDERRLHAVWEYRTNSDAIAIEYARSTDGGRTWGTRTTLDRPRADPKEMSWGYPLLAVDGARVHVIWIGGGVNNVGRRYRRSDDGGATWTPTAQILDPLVGATQSEGLITGPRGPVLVEQIRYPQAVYVAAENDGDWTLSPVYLIAKDHTDPIGDRIHAHWISTALHGSQQVITMATEPLPGVRVDLYAMHTLP